MEPAELDPTDHRPLAAALPADAIRRAEALERVVTRGRALRSRRRLAIAGGAAAGIVIAAAVPIGLATRNGDGVRVEAGTVGPSSSSDATGPAREPRGASSPSAPGTTTSPARPNTETLVHPTPGSPPSTIGSPPTTATAATSTTPPPTAAAPSSSLPPSSATLPHPTPSAPPEFSVPAPDGIGVAHLLGVTVARSGDRDVVRFALDAPVGVVVSVVDGPIEQDGSGAPISVSGGAHLRVRFFRASGYDGEQGAPSYTGPARVPGTGTGAVTEAVATGDFEGVVTWVIGIDENRPFAGSMRASGSGSGVVLEVTI